MAGAAARAAPGVLSDELTRDRGQTIPSRLISTNTKNGVCGMPKPSHHQPPVTWADVLAILDTHGLVLSDSGRGRRSREAKQLRRLAKTWLTDQGLHAGPSYVVPLRVLTELISAYHQDLIRAADGGVTWALVVNAINDTDGGLVLARRPFHRRRAA